MTTDDRPVNPEADVSFGLELDGEHDTKCRDRIGQECKFVMNDGSEVRTIVIDRKVQGRIASLPPRADIEEG